MRVATLISRTLPAIVTLSTCLLPHTALITSNVPKPARSIATIHFTLPHEGYAVVILWDITGRRVAIVDPPDRAQQYSQVN
jgi:hypothetical protein